MAWGGEAAVHWAGRDLVRTCRSGLRRTLRVTGAVLITRWVDGDSLSCLGCAGQVETLGP